MSSKYIKQTKAVINGLESHLGDVTKLPHVAPMRSEYGNDDSRCLTTVAFLTSVFAQRIDEFIIKPLKEVEPEHYYYPHEDLHITLKNIRANQLPPDFTAADTQKVNELLQQLIPTLPAITFQIEDVLVFPTNIWIAAYAGKEFQHFIREMDKGLASIGLKDNRKRASEEYFWANISVCRFVHQPADKFTARAAELRHTKIGSVTVAALDLITGNTVLHGKSRKVISTYAFAK